MALILWIFCAWGCVQLATRKGYGKGGAAVLGVLFGVFALIGYAVVPDKTR